MRTRALVTAARAVQVLVRSRQSLKPFSSVAGIRRHRILPYGVEANVWRGTRVVSMATESRTASYPYGPEVALQLEKPVSVSAGSATAVDWSGDLLVIGAFEDAFEVVGDKSVIKSEELKAVDAALGGALSDIVSLFDFKGKAGSSQTVRAGKAARFVSLAGLGAPEKATPAAEWGASVWQTLGGAVASAAKTNKAKTAAVALVGGNALSAEIRAAAAGRVANGIVNGGFESTRFKSKASLSPLASVELLFLGGGAPPASVARGVALARGALLTRYLVEAPANVCTPSYLAAAAAAIAAGAPDVMTLKVLEKAECEALGMGCFLGVAEASAEPPKFIHLTYSPAGGASRKVAIVGKGLTFDSGGYNIKAGAGSMIEMMKFDMGGAGATLGAARALADIRPDGVEVHFIVASCENMIDARGMRPGDVLVASNGLTVEVGNTDAEGRLTLADALVYAQGAACGAEAIVDIATLTGACMVALGGGIGGMYSPTDAMASGVAAAARTAGEKLWRMPLEESYFDQIKSPIADLKNTGGRMGGSITAALFLKEFVATDKVEWAHLDIAGPVWDDKAGGATGFGAQLLAEWAAAQGH